MKVPLGVFCAVTGVSGSGKSTLVNEILYKAVANKLNRARMRPGAHKRIKGLEHLDKIISVDQSPIGRTPRSNPATYIGLFDQIRDLYSKTQESRARGYKPGRFSFNVKGGRCEVCRGDGQIKIEMHFLPDIYVPCEQCHGKRYNHETLDIRFKGKTIADVLDMPGRRGARVLRPHPEDPPPPADAARRRPGLHAPRPAGHDALRRRGPAHQAGERAGQGRDRPDALHPRRADHRPALRRHPEAARGAAAPGRRGQLGRGHRAQPRRDQDRRPHHRHGPRRRRGGRPADGRRHPRGDRRGRELLHRPLPARADQASRAEAAGPQARAAQEGRQPRPESRRRGPHGSRSSGGAWDAGERAARSAVGERRGAACARRAAGALARRRPPRRAVARDARARRARRSAARSRAPRRQRAARPQRAPRARACRSPARPRVCDHGRRTRDSWRQPAATATSAAAAASAARGAGAARAPRRRARRATKAAATANARW